MVSTPWKLFLDDQCNEINSATNRPIRDCEKMYQGDNSFIQVESVEEAKKIIKDKGCPVFISFDHDLADSDQNGFSLAKWLVEKDMDSNQNFIPKEFTFKVHSANPIGKANIESYLNQYLSTK